MRRVREWQRSDHFAAPQKNPESKPALGRHQADASKAGQPKNIEQGGAIKGDRNSLQRKNLATPTVEESDVQRFPFHVSTTRPLPNPPGVAAQEDSADLLHPTRERALGELISTKPVTNSRPPTDIFVGTAEEQSEYVVFVKGDGLTHLQRRGNIRKPSPRWEDTQPTPLEQGGR